MSRNGIVILAGLCLLLLAVPFTGAERLDWRELTQSGSPSFRILFELRLPRFFLVLIAGGALACLGATYQILFHNPLAEPYLLGISSAVTLGTAASEICFQLAPYSYWGTVAGAIAALTVTALLAGVTITRVVDSMDRIVLFGLGLNFVLSSVLFLLLSYHNQQNGGGSMRWIFGHVPWISGLESMVFSVAAIPFLVALWLFARKLDALGLGDEVARTLGVDAARARLELLVLSSLFIALIVSFTGTIGFVGLVVPHAVRLCFRPATTRVLFGFAFTGGALFLSFSDVVSRILLPPLEFPIGIVTTVLGGPIFLYLLWKR